MNGANRKSKRSKYEVTVRREIEYVAVVEVEARNAEEAQEVALSIGDTLDAGDWRESHVISQTAKAKVVRG